VARRRTRRKQTSRTATRERRPSAGIETGQTFRYIESSALLAALLEQDVAALRAIRTHGHRVTSALTFAEAARALIRARVTGRLTAEQERAALRGVRTFERRCTIVAVSDEVLTRAGRPFPVEPIRTLDALHLASAELLGEPPQLVTVVTRDARVSENARALGYAVTI
jgi:predicted nucleic acid-binding protein